MNARVITFADRRAAELQREADAAELERLRAMERDLSRPVVELFHEKARLLQIKEAAIAAVAKVEQHERRGYDRIRIGAFAALRAALED